MINMSMFGKDKRIKALEQQVYALKTQNLYLVAEITVLKKRCVIVADSLSLQYTIDGVTFKSSNHMLSNLPKGKSVTLTVSGTGKDASGVAQPASITSIKVVASEGSLQVVPQPDGTFRLDAVADGGSGNLNVDALNSLGAPLSESDTYTTGAAAPVIVADTISLAYSAPFDTPTS